MARVRISVDEAFSEYEAGKVTMIDMLTTHQDLHTTRRIEGAIRIPAAELVDRLHELPRERGVIPYCT